MSRTRPPFPHAGLVTAALVLLVVATLAMAATGTGTAWADRPLLDAAVTARGPAQDTVIGTWSHLGGTVANWVMFGALVAVPALRGRRRDAAFVAAVGLGAWLLMVGLKNVLHRPRPPLELALQSPSSWSLPSGHATMAAALALTAVALAVPRSGRRGRAGMAVLAAGWALTMAGSRVYLGAHWFSDVVAGLALGTAWVLVVLWLFGPPGPAGGPRPAAPGEAAAPPPSSG